MSFRQNGLFLLTALLDLLCPCSAAAQEATYGPWDGQQEVKYYGNNKLEDYDVAIHITDAGLVGKTIRGIVVPFASDVSALRPRGAAFLSTSLSLDGQVNAPDIACDSFDITGGVVRAYFSQPYTIPARGVYVGYSFGLRSVVPAPLSVVSKENVNPENLYLHTTRTFRKWASRSLGYEAAMQVILSGVDADAVSLTLPGDVYTQVGVATDYNITLTNLGATEVRAVDYTYSLAGMQGTTHLDLATPLANQRGATATVPIRLPAIPDVGTYPLTLAVSRVNGNANTAETSTAEANVMVYKVLPTKRALLEEYTGTWCGWCPRGFVGLELMSDLLGDDFVGVSYHNNDPMAFTSKYPSAVSGFPAAWLDRAEPIDAYSGFNNELHFNIDKDYAKRNEEFGFADLSAQAFFTDATRNTVEVRATVLSPVDLPANKYQLSYLLTADGLTQSGDAYNQRGWDQKNYYSGGKYDDDMRQFVNASSSVSGLIYNFVVLGWSGTGALAGSLPASLTGDVAVSHTYTFDLSACVNASGRPIVQDKGKLHAVVLLIDTTTGEVVNALKAKVYDDATAGVHDAVAAGAGTDAPRYFSPDGKSLPRPQHGLNIVKVGDKTFKAFKK